MVGGAKRRSTNMFNTNATEIYKQKRANKIFEYWAACLLINFKLKLKILSLKLYQQLNCIKFRILESKWLISSNGGNRKGRCTV